MIISAEISPNAEATRAHAHRSVAHLKAGSVIRLHGPLGAGKSEWVRGLAGALGIPGQVPSPTFTLCQPLRGGRLSLDHWDLYRLEGARDWDSLGWPDCLVTPGLVAVEWPDRYPGHWPATVVDLEILPQPDGSRKLCWIRKS